MDAWFLRDMQRLTIEREAIQHLEETTKWLKRVSWFLPGDGLICVDAIICVHSHEYLVRMLYPALFPATPPIMRPINPKACWSSHQYLSGTLCLEWGSDNWHPDVTGAHLLKSAHKLLYLENSLGTRRHKIALSRHHLSVGQSLRSSFGRLYVSSELANYVENLPTKTVGAARFSLQEQSRSILALIPQIHPFELESWQDTSIPPIMCAEISLTEGIFVKTALETRAVERIEKVKEIEEILTQTTGRSISLSNQGSIISMGLEHPPQGALLVDRFNHTHFFIFNPANKRTSYMKSLPINKDEINFRIPSDFERLHGKHVGIVGLGSFGSKIALSLARAGVTYFSLMDDDIFQPENICRHTLDWRNIGEHKVDAVAQALTYIAPDIHVAPLHLNFTGQESTSYFDGILNKLGECDILIDATANPQVFNIMTHLSMADKKPLVWGEIYSGGIGGMLARSRPGRDPDPHTMRAAYYGYTAETPPPELVTTHNYTAENAHGKIFSASDADVSVLAAQTTQLIIDTLLEREPSTFPYSMYLVGFTRAWIFEAPFHTIPIATDHLIEQVDPELIPEQLYRDTTEFILELLEKHRKYAYYSSQTYRA